MMGMNGLVLERWVQKWWSWLENSLKMAEKWPKLPQLHEVMRRLQLALLTIRWWNFSRGFISSCSSSWSSACMVVGLGQQWKTASCWRGIWLVERERCIYIYVFFFFAQLGAQLPMLLIGPHLRSRHWRSYLKDTW